VLVQAEILNLKSISFYVCKKVESVFEGGGWGGGRGSRALKTCWSTMLLKVSAQQEVYPPFYRSLQVMRVFKPIRDHWRGVERCSVFKLFRSC
jgi:hypothetical protein